MYQWKEQTPSSASLLQGKGKKLILEPGTEHGSVTWSLIIQFGVEQETKQIVIRYASKEILPRLERAIGKAQQPDGKDKQVAQPGSHDSRKSLDDTSQKHVQGKGHWHSLIIN